MRILYSLFFLCIAFYCEAQKPGTIDKTFGRSGRQSDTVGLNADFPAMIVQPDGKILVGGSGFLKGSGIRTFRIDRLTKNGAPDKTFGDKGTVLIEFHFSANEENHTAEVTALGIRSDGKIIAAGVYRKNREDAGIITLVRLLPDGKPDNSFADSGIAQTKTKYGISRPSAMQIQADNKIVLGGYFLRSYGALSVYLLERLQANGKLDAAFGNGGQIYDSLGALTALAIQPDGKILAGGEKDDYRNRQRFLLRRYLATGALDNSFANNGTLDTAISYLSYVTDIAVLPDGKIMAAGESGAEDGSFPYFTLARFSASGKTDKSFGKKGVMAESSHIAYCRKMLISGSKILMAGTDYQTRRGSYATDCIVHAYDENGNVDTSFANKGELRIEDKYYNYLGTAALQADGKLLLLEMGRDNAEGTDYSLRNLLRYYGYPAQSSSLRQSNKLLPPASLVTITLSPNPATGYVVVNGLAANGKTILTVTDALGKRMALCQVNNASQYRMDVSKLIAGLYYVQINTGGKTEVRKFIKE